MVRRRRRVLAAAGGLALLAAQPSAAQLSLPSLMASRNSGQAAQDLTVLTELVSLAGLTPTLQQTGPFTVFGPSDAAFSVLPGGTMDMLKVAKPNTDLRTMVSFHALNGNRAASSFAANESVTTLETQSTLVVQRNTATGTVSAYPAYGVAASAVTAGDIAAQNGVLHVVNAVLVPPSVTLPTRDLLQRAADLGHSSFVSAVGTAGLTATLTSTAQTSHLTCFVPTNAAFAAIPSSQLTLLLATQSSLMQLLRYHCTSGFLPVSRLTAIAQSAGSRTVQMLDGGAVPVSLSGSTLQMAYGYSGSERHFEELQNAQSSLTTTDIFTTSGVFHTIDRVLIPTGFIWPGTAVLPTPPPAEWTQAWPTPWVHCPQIPYQACPELLPLKHIPVEVSTTTEVSIQVQAWCNGRPLGGLASGDCAAHANWEVLDGGSVVSTMESQLQVSVAPGTVLSLVLIDLSNSINQNSQAIVHRKNAAIRYIDTVLSAANVALTGPHMVAVYAFDGRRDTQLVSVGIGQNGWSSDRAALVNAVNALSCGISPATGIGYCQDPSTNLHGAVIWAARHLQSQARPEILNGRNTTCGLDAFLVFFTDGLDQANYGQSATDVRNEIATRGVKAFAVSHEGTTTYQELLTTMVGDPKAVFITNTRENIPVEFAKVAEVVVAYASRAYEIKYCSPRRAGAHPLQVRARYNGVTGATMEFVVGEEVRYNGAETARVTSVDRYNVAGDTYTILLSSGQSAIVRGSQLELMYTTTNFLTPSCLRLRADASASSTNEATRPYSAPAAALVQQRVAPYSCTGGSEYSCSAQRCECVGGVSAGANSMCPQSAAALPAATTAVRECTGGFPVAPAPFARFNLSTDSRLSLDFNAVCNDGLPFGGISFSPCSSLSSLTLLESDFNNQFHPVSLYESRPRITCLSQPAHVLSLLLLDTSASIVRGAGGIQALKAAVIAYLDGLQEKVMSHTVAVHTFDGRAGTQEVIAFGSDLAATKAAINALSCDGVNHCADPSSNLFGAIVHTNDVVLANFDTSPLAVAADGVRRQPYLVIFSDGTDSARRATEQQAIAAAAFGRGVISVGLHGEVPTPAMSFTARGVNTDVLNRLSTNGVYVADSANLAAAFAGVGDAIATSSATQFRLDYCSPKRQGLRVLRLEFRPQGGRFQGQRVTYWQQAFDASQFLCGDNRCARCLGGLNNEVLRKTCSNQPGPFQQSFVCEADAQPLNVNGYCRCPCSSQASYPPATQEGPGPIKCEAPGTCFGRRPQIPEGICAPRGGLPPTVPGQSSVTWTRTGRYWTANDGTRFGTAPNSHVSIEFVPKCADGWTVSGLRMSACSGLSDFQVFETDATSTFAPVLVDPWESEPRVVCHPDIATLILIDTSGSIKQGSTEASLRLAVLEYLEKLNATSQELDISHHVAIYAFDGRNTLQTIAAFGSADTAKAAMAGWSCDGANFCVDPSTDLYGAVIQAEAILRSDSVGQSWTTRRFFVLFTDGTDQAARQAEQTAIANLQAAQIANGLSVYGVGLIGERKDGSQGLDSQALQNLAFSGVYIATAASQLPDQFEFVAERVRDSILNAATATYRIDYCSPKRSGLRQTIIRLSLEGSVTEWISPVFNASEFSCLSGACTQCLRNREFNCQYQPQQAPGDRDPQFFSCSTGDPTAQPGSGSTTVCKCPCSGTYPPDPTPAPSPGVTSPPGTQVSTPVLTCQQTGSVATDCQSTFMAPLTLSMATATAGAQIYYTTDGTVPTTGSPLYVGPVTWNTVGSIVVRAIAVSTGLGQSAMVERVMVVTSGPVPTPFVTPNPVITNVAPTAVVSIPRVTAIAGTPVSQTNVITGISGPEVGQVVTGQCTPQVPALFAVAPVLAVAGSSGTLTFTPASTASGETLVTCVLTDNGVPQRQTTVSLVISVTRNTPAPVVPQTCPSGAGRPVRTMRLKLLGDVSSFRKAAFASVVNGVTSQPLISPHTCVFSVCPASACEPPLAPVVGQCPTATADKRARGCLLDSFVPGRVAEALQTGSYVDFDIVTAAADTSAQRDAQRTAVLVDLNSDIARCNAAQTPCSVGTLRHAGQVAWVYPNAATPAPTTASSSGDDGMSTGLLVGIIVGSILCALLICLVLFLLIRSGGKKKGAGRGTEMSPHLDRDAGKDAGWQSVHSDPSVHSPKQPIMVPPQSAPGVSFADPPAEFASTASHQHRSPHGSPPRQMDGQPLSYQAGQRVRALYLDGEYYEATIWSTAPDGTYGVQWYDGTHSDGIPPDQIEPLA